MARRYLFDLCCTAALLLAAVALFNHRVDPYSLAQSTSAASGTRYKPAVQQRIRLLKAWQTRHRRPDSVVLGSSRAHLGIRPSHPRWRARAERPFNLAFDGATTKEMFLYLRHAQAVSPLKLAIVGLDTWHLTSEPGSTRPDFDQAFLDEGAAAGDLLRRLGATIKLLTSVDTTLDSLAWVFDRRNDWVDYLADDGQRLGDVFFHRPEGRFAEIGPRAYFEEIEKLEVRFKLGWRRPRRAPKTYPPRIEARDPVTSLGYVGKIIDFCRAHEIELKLFISPSHAWDLELSRLAGEGPAIDRHKRLLVDGLARDAAAHPGAAPYQLIDFSDYSSVTTEPLPEAGSRKEMTNYWDPSHYKQLVGDRILDCLLGGERCASGHALTSDSLDPTLAEIAGHAEQYRQRATEDLASIRGYVDDFKREEGIFDR